MTEKAFFFLFSRPQLLCHNLILFKFFFFGFPKNSPSPPVHIPVFLRGTQNLFENGGERKTTTPALGQMIHCQRNLNTLFVLFLSPLPFLFFWWNTKEKKNGRRVNGCGKKAHNPTPPPFFFCNKTKTPLPPNQVPNHSPHFFSRGKTKR